MRTHERSSGVILLLAVLIATWLGVNVHPSASSAQAQVPPTQTPIAVTAGIATPFGYGVASGDVSSDSAVLWTRMPATAEVIPEISAVETFEPSLRLPAVMTSADHDFTVHVTAPALQAGTQCWYRFWSGADLSAVGTFRTAYAPTQDATVRLAFTGDAHWSWKPFPIFNSIVQEPLDFFLFLGDLFYESMNLEGGKNGSIAAETLDELRFKYRENREPAWGSGYQGIPMQELYRSFGQYSVFDNHETANSRERGAPPYITGGATVDGQFVNQTPGYLDRMQAYTEYQPVRQELVSGTGDPRLDQTQRFYRAIPWGANAELIVLDDRSYRDEALADAKVPAALDCSRTMLGGPQLSWLEGELQAAQARRVTWKLVVISSPIQELGKERDGVKSWAGGYVCERDRLLRFIDDSGINNVVFLTTDNHYTMINNLQYNAEPGDPSSPLKPARNAFEIITGPLGADTDDFAAALKVSRYGLPTREVDRRTVETWNGQMANSAGVVNGLIQAGFDPIGLEADFPGLVASSVWSNSTALGDVQPAAFATFNTFAYALLEIDRTTLSVRVKGFPAVVDPMDLADPQLRGVYEHRVAEDILSFQLQAQ